MEDRESAVWTAFPSRSLAVAPKVSQTQFVFALPTLQQLSHLPSDASWSSSIWSCFRTPAPGSPPNIRSAIVINACQPPGRSMRPRSGLYCPPRTRPLVTVGPYKEVILSPPSDVAKPAPSQQDVTDDPHDVLRLDTSDFEDGAPATEEPAYPKVLTPLKRPREEQRCSAVFACLASRGDRCSLLK